jgi:hypothetical protein
MVPSETMERRGLRVPGAKETDRGSPETFPSFESTYRDVDRSKLGVFLRFEEV